MAWFRCIGNNGGGGGGNFTDAAWDGTLIPNVYIDKTTGQEISYAGWSATDYIDISSSSNVYRCGNIILADYNAWYDSSKTFISGFSNGSIDSVPNNAAYVRYSKTTGAMVGKIFTSV